MTPHDHTSLRLASYPSGAAPSVMSSGAAYRGLPQKVPLRLPGEDCSTLSPKSAILTEGGSGSAPVSIRFSSWLGLGLGSGLGFGFGFGLGLGLGLAD